MAKSPSLSLTLPGTLEEVCSLLKNDSTSDDIKTTLRKFTGGSLLSGRPLDSLQILLAGYSGSGKSSTINFLFNDSSLCPTNPLKSETRDPVKVQKRLTCDQARGPQIEAILSMVDLPGNSDSDSRNEVCNLASIRKFIDSSFACREGISIKGLDNIRPKAYPNLIFFTIKATDNRLEGNNTNLRNALMILKRIDNLIDIERPNLIILITHVCSLGLQSTYFNQDLIEKKATVRKVVKDVLGITDVDIIPIENQPDRYGLPKTEGGAYYKLPNEELSPYNLYQAMLKCLERNEDHIGLLLTNWYFLQSSCPERQDKAEVIQPFIEVEYAEVAQAASDLHDLQRGINPQNPVTIFKFQHLGFGFDPAKMELKRSTVPRVKREEIGNMNGTEIRGNKFLIPSYVRDTVKDSAKFQRLTFLEKGEYLEHMKQSYGIDKNFTLNVITGSDRKWMNDYLDWTKIRKLSFSQDVNICNMQLLQKDEIFKDSVFHKELTSLPTEYNSEETAKKYLEFFAKWGTHLICEVDVGGTFQLNCTVNRNSATKENVKEIEKVVKKKIEELFGKQQAKNENDCLRNVGVIEEKVEILGGDGSEETSFEWENITPDDVENWKNSLYVKPVELPNTIKLVPYYELLDEQQDEMLRKSLFEATKRYMEEPGASCFPPGTLVYMAGGGIKRIEELENCGGNHLQTVGINRVHFGISMKLGNVEDIEFCTFLDKKPNEYLEYLVFQFSNGKKLLVSPGHMIFQYLSTEECVVGKQAKNFQPGEKAVYMEHSSGDAEYPEIETISRELRLGAYSPLTASGTFFADGFLVSSYANIDSFGVAQGALLPLKMWCKVNRKNRKIDESTEGVENRNNGMHPYAKFLMSFRKLLTSHVTPK